MGGAKLLLALALVVTALGLAACGDEDEDEGGTTAGAEEIGTTAEEGGEPILIKTHVAALEDPDDMTTGEVLPGSTIGDSAFCPGGTFRDAAVRPPSALVVRAFRCPGGQLTISFTSTPPDVEQRSDWEVVRGGGRFEGLSGGGRMRAVAESSLGEARETFTGTVTR
jgi:hypothetical protein